MRAQSADAAHPPALDDGELQAPMPSSLLLRPGVSERLAKAALLRPPVRARGLRSNQFQRRGRSAARSEWRLITATHNLMKLHKHHLAAQAA